MKATQLGVLLSGIVLVITLYFLRNSPEQTNALDALLAVRVDSLSAPAADQWEILSQTWSEETSDEQLDTLIGFWKTQDEPAVAAVLALPRAESSGSLTYNQSTADLLMEAVRTGRENKSEGINDNLLFFLTEKSAELYNQLIEADSSDLDARVGLAGVFIDGKGQIMPGVQQLLTVLRVDSLHLPANLRLGRLSMINGEYGNVIKRMKKVLQVDPAMGEAYVTIASAYQALGDSTAARSYLEQSLPYLKSETLLQEVKKRLNEL